MKIIEKEINFQHLIIELETEEELVELFSVVNYIPVIDSCKTMIVLHKLLSDILKSRKIDYSPTFSKIIEKIGYKEQKER